MLRHRSRWLYVGLGVALRATLLGWGMYQDQHMSLPYTDVDYTVYNDGARALWSGCPLAQTVESPLYHDEEDLYNVPALASQVHCARGLVPVVSRFVLKNDPTLEEPVEQYFYDSESLWSQMAVWCFKLTRPLFRFFASIGDPYSRDTYRYTPLLALLLSPAQAGEAVWPLFGKVLFALADVACAILMWAILDERAAMHAHEAPALAKAWTTHLPGLLWLLNPFPAQIATRGSADSLVGVLVLAFVYLLIRATPEVALIQEPQVAELPPPHDPSELRVAHPACWWGAALCLALAAHLKLYPVIYGASVLAHLSKYRFHALRLLCGIRKPQRHDVLWLGTEFAALCAILYLLLGGLVWLIWGNPYIHHALLYHVMRQDHRHNFSVYFLPTYLTWDWDTHMSWVRALAASPLVSFVPQMATVAIAGFTLGGYDLVLACMVQTVVFVAWNKVYTSQVRGAQLTQYFLWYLWFLPVVGTTLSMSRTEVLTLMALWVGAQALWLGQAYQLEFMAQNTFVHLWLSSLGLLFVHVFCVQRCLQGWRRWRRKQAVAKQKAE
ncbi:GPI mannosyltransferase 1 [Malassezia nana]|uniref:GPI mannosyltransferase 1 n=1 Tax=Malassezia nana TaxID=180528 RepID=A0AAF0J4B5_9BASI|nr:GPI mannosyltransferase 1 [Malassezia nana]